jgi:hypothetical protein
MGQAAQQLDQAAQQLAQQQQGEQGKPGQPGMPGPRGAQGGGAPDLGALSPDLKQYAGKSWGELPGHVRTRIVQEMKARYGDDHAEMIRLYFEQIAEPRK